MAVIFNALAWAEKHGLFKRNAFGVGVKRFSPDDVTQAKSVNAFGAGCFFCGRAHENFDHFLPCSRGGHSHWRNLVPSCTSCNSAKENRLPTQAEAMKYERCMWKFTRHHTLKVRGWRARSRR